MRNSTVALILSVMISHTSNASLQSDQFQEAGFTAKSVIGSTFQFYNPSSESFERRASSKSLALSAIDALNHAKASKTKGVDYCYILNLLTGSSFDSQKLMVYMDSAGNGYFQHGNEPVVYFHSPDLAQIFLKHANETEQGAAANP